MGMAIEVDGVRRLAGGDGFEVHVVDSDAHVELAREPMLDAYAASLDPSLTTLCVELREMRGGAPTEIAAYDLERRAFRWRETLVAEGAPGTVVRVLATPDVCAVVVRTTYDRLELRSLLHGSPVPAEGITPFETVGGTTALFSDDRSTLVLSRWADAANGTRAMWLDVRDGHTLARRAQLWARCAEVGARVRLAPDERIEDAARQAYLERLAPDLVGDCETTAPPPPPVFGVAALPSPWVPLTADVVAVHDEDGLFLWDHLHRRSPVRVEGAPGLVRFVDVNGRSRPVELVVPPDGAWIGVVRAEGSLARFDAATGAALDDRTLPTTPPTDADAAEWQVFAGARGRLLAIRDVEGHRAVFVGDGVGPWRRSPARTFGFIRQSAEHEDARGAWLVSCPHYGVSRVDETTGRVLAAFLPSDTFSRTTVGVPSPDGTEIFVGVANVEGDDDGGLYFLDATSLEVLRRFEDHGWAGPSTAVVWTADGVLIPQGTAGVRMPDWASIDPTTGEGHVVAHGAPHIDFTSSRRTEVHAEPALEGGAFLSSGGGDDERWLHVTATGAAIEEADGRVWCEGTGCDHFRCVTSALDALPVDDPACAAMRLE